MSPIVHILLRNNPFESGVKKSDELIILSGFAARSFYCPLPVFRFEEILCSHFIHYITIF